LFLLHDSGRITHFAWRGNKEIIAWAGLSNSVNRIRKSRMLNKLFFRPLLPIYKKLVKANAVTGHSRISGYISADSYVLFEDKKNRPKPILPNLLKKDGHPSFSPKNKEWFITDTYPDNDAIQDLFLINIRTNKVILVDRIQSDPEYSNSSLRSDLHPKWSYNGKTICIDVINRGIRQMKLYDVSKLMKDD
jgi:hypothetical protein